VTKPNGELFVFQESEDGLHCLDVKTHAENKTTLVAAAADGKSKHTNSDCLKAKLARELQIIAGRPSMKDFICIINSNQLPNCPTTKADMLAAKHIFGPDIGSLKGKMTR